MLDLKKIVSRDIIKEFIFSFWLVIVLILEVVFFFFAFKHYIEVAKDILNNLLLLSIFFMLLGYIKDNRDLKNFIQNIFVLTVVLAIIIAFSNVSRVLNLPIADYLFNSDYINGKLILKYGSELSLDYNFGLIPVFFAFIIVLYEKTKINFWWNITKVCILLLFLMQIGISGSKRGVFLIILIHMLILSGLLIENFSKYVKFSKFAKTYILVLLLIIIPLIIVFVNTNVQNKNKILRNVGITNLGATKEIVTDKLHRLTLIINPKTTFENVYRFIWNPEFNSKDPDSGWGKGNYTTIFELPGDNDTVVPDGSLGYMLNKNCLSVVDSLHAYFSPLIQTIELKKSDTLVASVYCYVSQDFDGDVVSIETDSRLCGRITSKYNLEQKGLWQKLSLVIACDSIVPIYFYLNKSDVKSFNQLKGYVIYAYPEFNLIKKNFDSHSCNKCVYQNLLTTKDYLKFIKYSSMPFSSVKMLNFKMFDFQEPIHQLIDKNYTKDTTFYPLETDLPKNFVVSSIQEDRLNRWKFAVYIFKYEYSIGEKLFGGGFKFLNWYGLVFKNDKQSIDYPHNPFLHILLYSGIIGIILYCCLLFRVVIVYWKYRKEFPILLIFFLITFYFTIFSGGTPFNPPITGFILMLPFFIELINKNEKYYGSY